MHEETKKSAANIYKTLKEDFVSNLSGGSITEISIVTAVATSCYILYAVLQSKYHLFSSTYGIREFLLDFLINVGGLLLSITLYSSNSWMFHAAILAPALILYLSGHGSSLKRQRKPKFTVKERLSPEEKSTSEDSGKTPDITALLPRKAYLSTYRGTMMVVTCLAILAVDFRIFPRRFAKVETLGTSLMDLGVGSFVFSGGLVSARSLLKEQYVKKTDSLGTRLYKSIRSSVALLVMGFVRLLLTKGADYHEHVSEYGQHWNFFFTLGFLPPFTALFQSLFALIPSYAFWSLLLGTLYEGALDTTGLKTYILTAERIDLITANKEGIFSFIGYLAIFLAGQAAGMSVLPKRSSPTKPLVVQAVLWTGLFLLTTEYVFGINLTVSRRLANLPYVLWVGAYNCWHILLFYGVERVFFGQVAEGRATYDERVPMILRSFNKNGLVVFLVANLLTGLVNKTFDTIRASNMEAMVILVTYALILTAFAVTLDMRGITVKF